MNLAKVLAGGEAVDFWMPNQGSNIGWLAATNRYFALAMMPAEAATRPSLEDQIRRIRVTPIATNDGGEDDQQILVTTRTSATRLDAGQNRTTSFRIWAGPQDRSLLREASTVQGLQLDRLVVYSMGGFCTFCTFQWLASLLLSDLRRTARLRGRLGGGDCVLGRDGSSVAAPDCSPLPDQHATVQPTHGQGQAGDGRVAEAVCR